jgi:hypothetical protein
MNELLNWAIEHSDPEALQQQADEAKTLTVEERKAAFEAKFTKEELERFFGSESNRMSKPIGVLVNATYNSTTLPSDRNITIALQQLQEHVEDIDKANDLHKMGGLTPLLWLLQHRTDAPRITQWVLHTLGTAAAHNPKVQDQMVELGVLDALVTTLSHKPPEHVLAKALYAMSCVCGNHGEAIQQLYVKRGPEALQQLMAVSSARVHLKVRLHPTHI